MVTEHTNTVYNCAACARPIYFNAGHRSWFHHGTKTGHPTGPLCATITPVTVRLTLPARAGLS